MKEVVQNKSKKDNLSLSHDDIACTFFRGNHQKIPYNIKYESFFALQNEF